jgi:hypothetical protein
MSEPATAFVQPGYTLSTTFPAEGKPSFSEVRTENPLRLKNRSLTASEADEVARLPATADLASAKDNRVLFFPLQEWEGVVTEIFADCFVASMVDLSAPEKGLQDVAEFPLTDVCQMPNPC